jgi:hypothetical protein
VAILRCGDVRIEFHIATSPYRHIATFIGPGWFIGISRLNAMGFTDDKDIKDPLLRDRRTGFARPPSLPI